MKQRETVKNTREEQMCYRLIFYITTDRFQIFQYPFICCNSVQADVKTLLDQYIKNGERLKCS